MLSWKIMYSYLCILADRDRVIHTQRNFECSCTHHPRYIERESLEYQQKEGANLQEMTPEEAEMLHDAVSNVPLSTKHLITTGTSFTANISKHIVILQCTARVRLQGAHEDLGKCRKLQPTTV
jgi:hypothetical protein